jgi:uncharacterized LabA/DUF88 family protein
MVYSKDGILVVRVRKTVEKGSDVNLAAHLINDAHRGSFDEAVVLSGDSDLYEAVRIVTRDIRKSVTIVNPATGGFASGKLLRVASHYRHIHENELRTNQFPLSLSDSVGMITKPSEWL